MSNSMPYETFQKSYKILIDNHATNSELFDSLLLPFVSSLGYNSALANVERQPGDMLITHNSSNQHQKITAYPDKYSKIVFYINADINKIEYNADTFIVNIDTDKNIIQSIIPCFGKYVTNYYAKFFNQKEQYTMIVNLIDYNSRKYLPIEKQQKFLYLLAVMYDTQQSGINYTFIDMINSLVNDNDKSFIDLIVNKISEKSLDFVPKEIIKNKIIEDLKNQTETEYYYFSFVDKNKPDVTKSIPDKPQENNVLDVFNKLKDNKDDNNKGENEGGNKDASAIFKQRE